MICLGFIRVKQSLKGCYYLLVFPCYFTSADSIACETSLFHSTSMIFNGNVFEHCFIHHMIISGDLVYNVFLHIVVLAQL